MKKFVLKKSPNETLIASLEIETLFSKNATEAFPVVNAWVRDITNGEMFLLLAEGGYYVSTFKKNLNLDDNSENAELFQPVSPLNEV